MWFLYLNAFPLSCVRSGIVTTMSVYRGKSSIYEYLTAGTVTGSLYKMNMGLRGMAVGGLLGGSLGAVAGAVSLLVLKVSGKSMEEVRYWQYQWKTNRVSNIRESMKVKKLYICFFLLKIFFLQSDEPDEMLKRHDLKLNQPQMNLDQIDVAKS